MNPRARVAVVLLSLACGLSVLDGCFRHRQQVIQRESMGYLRFTGRTSGARFHVARDSMVVWPSTKVRRHKKYAARPGSYVLTVEKKGEPVLRRILLLVDDEITEVTVP